MVSHSILTAITDNTSILQKQMRFKARNIFKMFKQNTNVWMQRNLIKLDMHAGKWYWFLYLIYWITSVLHQWTTKLLYSIRVGLNTQTKYVCTKKPHSIHYLFIRRLTAHSMQEWCIWYYKIWPVRNFGNPVESASDSKHRTNH